MSEDYRFRLAPREPDPRQLTAAELDDRVGLAARLFDIPPHLVCDHGATVTRRLDLIDAHPDGTYTVIGRTTNRVTACLICHHLAPTPQEDPQP